MVARKPKPKGKSSTKVRNPRGAGRKRDKERAEAKKERNRAKYNKAKRVKRALLSEIERQGTQQTLARHRCTRLFKSHIHKSGAVESATGDHSVSYARVWRSMTASKEVMRKFNTTHKSKPPFALKNEPHPHAPRWKS
jgi:hypothetical protein